jgi:hypothetical protein
MKTEKQIRKRLKRLLKKPVDWFSNSANTEKDYHTIRVLKWILK